MTEKEIEEAAIEYSTLAREQKAFEDGAYWALSHQWISVKDKMPQSLMYVVATEGFGKVHGVYYDSEDSQWKDWDSDKTIKVAYWMQVPVIRKEEKK